MDKLVDHLFVFEGNGVVRDFPGNYTEYRDRKELEDKQKPAGQPEPVIEKEKTEEKKFAAPEIKTPEPAANKRKPTFKEKFEYEQLEKEIAKLEEEKAAITKIMDSGITDHEEIMKHSERIAKIIAELDEKGLRWLELSELI
jgi:ATP-binding cassette subfamily F protein uup